MVIYKALATLFYTGFFPIAPGTAGTAAALLVYYLLPVSLIEAEWFFVIPLILVFPSVYICGKAEEQMERDDSRIVLDEFAGYFISILFLPKTLLIAILAFVLFRLFDILKPSPVAELQSLKKGWGIVFDDLMAGVYANLCLQIIYFLLIA